MIMPGESKTEASRCLFVIDPNQIVRAMIYYPLTTGRNMDEILRLIDALQTTDKHGVATPANWRPGDQVIVPPPRTIEAAAERTEMPESSAPTGTSPRSPFRRRGLRIAMPFPRPLKRSSCKAATDARCEAYSPVRRSIV